MYTFILNVEVSTMKKVRTSFEKAVAATGDRHPLVRLNHGGVPTNRWIQSEYQFVVDLPEGGLLRWPRVKSPFCMPTLRRRGSGRTICSFSQRKKAVPTMPKARQTLPADLENVDPTCKVRFSRVIRTKDDRQALETVVDVKRGPFAMTIHEWRFRGERYDYELKFTVERLDTRHSSLA